MADPWLPFDVLLIIMALLERSDVMSMSLTCRTLRHGGARFMLQEGAALSTSEQAISFISFMRADSGSRIHHLHSLELTTGIHFSRRGIDALRGLVTHQHLALESLSLLDAEALLMCDVSQLGGKNLASNSLLEALASLTTLKHLTMDRCDEYSIIFIRSLSSSLVTASLKLQQLTSWSVVTDPDERNPIVLLARSSETLQELSGTGFEVDERLIKYGTVYPAVKKISAEYTQDSMPGTLVYINAFPNLEYLALTSPYNRYEDASDDLNASRIVHERRRAANMEDQEKYQCTWQVLQEVVGSVVDLFTLGLVCHVPRMRIRDGITAVKCSFLEDILANVRPSNLAITLAGTSLLGGGGPLYRALQLGNQQLRALELEVRFGAHEAMLSLDDVLVSLFD